MNELLLEFDLAIMKNDQIYECSAMEIVNQFAFADKMVIESYTGEDADNDGLYAEGVEQAIAAVKKWFEEFIAAIKDFIRKAVLNFQTYLAQKKVNQKLKELKTKMAQLKKERAKLDGEKVTIFDTAKFFKEYTAYINESIRIGKKFLATKFESYEDVQKANAEMQKEQKAAEEKFDLDNVEKFQLEMGIRAAYEYTMKEVANSERMGNIIMQNWTEYLSDLAKAATDKDAYKANAAKSAASNTKTFKKGIFHIFTSRNADKIINKVDSIKVDSDAEEAKKEEGKDLTSDKEKKNMDNDKKAADKN